LIRLARPLFYRNPSSFGISYCHKGSKVYIEGRIGSREYTDREGVKRTAWEVTATELELLTPKDAGGGAGGYAGTPAEDDVPF